MDGMVKIEVSYKADFISSIINGDDVPKIMEYTLLGDELQKKRILDGGHRTRCIDGLWMVNFQCI